MSEPRLRTAELSDTITRVARLVKAHRHRTLRLVDGLEPALVPILFQLEGGSHRVSDVASCVHSDVSTISRQITTLTHLGLVSKTPDPDDGRAQRVALTEPGAAILVELRQQREESFEFFLAEWSVEEVAALQEQMQRLADSIEARIAGADGAPQTRTTLPPTTSENHEHHHRR